MRFTSLSTLKSFYLLDKQADADDDGLELLLEEAEDIFERGTNRRFSPDPDLTAQLTTALTGANNDLVFTASKSGMTIAYSVSGTNTVLTIDVTGSAITVIVGTNGAGAPVSTAAQVRTALNASGACVTAELAGGNDGSGVVTGMAAAAIPSDVDSATPVLKRLSTGGRRIGDTLRGQVFVPIPDLRAVTSVLVGGAAMDPATSPGVYPLDGYELVYQRPGEPATGILLPNGKLPACDDGEGDLAITGRWGFLEAPAAVRGACYLIAAKGYRERDANYAEQVETEAGISTYFRSMPARAWTTYQLYKRRGS